MLELYYGAVVPALLATGILSVFEDSIETIHEIGEATVQNFFKRRRAWIKSWTREVSKESWPFMKRLLDMEHYPVLVIFFSYVSKHSPNHEAANLLRNMELHMGETHGIPVYSNDALIKVYPGTFSRVSSDDGHFEFIRQSALAALHKILEIPSNIAHFWFLSGFTCWMMREVEDGAKAAEKDFCKKWEVTGVTKDGLGTNVYSDGLIAVLNPSDEPNTDLESFIGEDWPDEFEDQAEVFNYMNALESMHSEDDGW